MVRIMTSIPMAPMMNQCRDIQISMNDSKIDGQTGAEIKALVSPATDYQDQLIKVNS